MSVLWALMPLVWGLVRLRLPRMGSQGGKTPEGGSLLDSQRNKRNAE